MRSPATSGCAPGNPCNLSCHVRSPTPLRLPCCEEPQSRRGRWRRGRERETGRPGTPRAKPMSEKPSRKWTLQPLLAPCRSIRDDVSPHLTALHRVTYSPGRKRRERLPSVFSVTDFRAGVYISHFPLYAFCKVSAVPGTQASQ